MHAKCQVPNSPLNPLITLAFSPRSDLFTSPMHPPPGSTDSISSGFHSHVGETSVISGNAEVNTDIGKQNSFNRNADDIIMDLEPPPAIHSPSTNEYKTPPLQTNGNFVDDAGTQIASENNYRGVYYSKIQNLPTPIAAHRPDISNEFTHGQGRGHENGLGLWNSSTVPMQSPLGSGRETVFPIQEEDAESQNHSDDLHNNYSRNSHKSFDVDVDRGNMSGIILPKLRSGQNTNTNANPLVIQKGRRARLSPDRNHSILSDATNVNNSFPEINPPKRFISEFRDFNHDNSGSINTDECASFNHFSRLNNGANFKPVDRVVSLPPHRIQTALPQDWKNSQYEDFKMNTIPPAEERKEVSYQKKLTLTPELAITYSIDSQHTLQKWVITKEIGSGSFSRVYLANDGITAIKITDVNFNTEKDRDGADKDGELTARIQNSLTREIEVLKSLSHPNIIKLIGTDYDKSVNGTANRITMAIDYCKGGDLFSFVSENDHVDLKIIRYIFANLVAAIQYMHHLDIVHRDIKLENVLLKFSALEIFQNIDEYIRSKVAIVLLSDFGLSKKVDPETPMMTTRCGSEDYVSPELLLGMPYDGKQNDCWALGVVLYTMLENRLPFDPLPSEHMKVNSHSRRSKPSHRIAMISWAWFNVKGDDREEMKLAKAMVKSLLTKRNKRATIDEIASSDWCKGYI